MVIRKQYDIGQLVEQLQTEIENSKKCSVVKIDILTANNILDVLNETNRREHKHQTLESALTFMEKEDGTQTNENEMEIHSKQEIPDCIGMYSEKENPEYCARCTNELLCKIIEEQKTKQIEQQEQVNPKCFGGYMEGNVDCGFCDVNEECEKHIKYCFGDFYARGNCKNKKCECREKCIEQSKINKEEENKDE